MLVRVGQGQKGKPHNMTVRSSFDTVNLVVSVTSLIIVSPHSIPRTLLFLAHDLLCLLPMVVKHQQSE